MDPEATVCAILSAASRMDGSAVTDGIEALRGWLSRGGFRPYGWTRDEVAAFCAAFVVIGEALVPDLLAFVEESARLLSADEPSVGWRGDEPEALRYAAARALLARAKGGA